MVPRMYLSLYFYVSYLKMDPKIFKKKYSKSYDYVPLPLPSITVFEPILPNVTQRYTNVTDHYIPLLTVTEFTVTCVTSVTNRNIVCFEQIFKVLLKKLM